MLKSIKINRLRHLLYWIHLQFFRCEEFIHLLSYKIKIKYDFPQTPKEQKFNLYIGFQAFTIAKNVMVQRSLMTVFCSSQHNDRTYFLLL